MIKPIRILPFFLLFILSIHSYEVWSQSAYELFKEGKEYRSKGRKNKAVKSFEQALEQAEKDRNTSLQMSCHIELAELKDNVINYKEALDHYKAFTNLYKKQLNQEKEELEDSVTTLESTVEEKESEISDKDSAIQNLTKEQLESELNIKNLELKDQNNQLSIQQKELDLQQSQKNAILLIGIIVVAVVVLAFFGLGYVRKRKTNLTLRNKNYQIAKEKEKSDELLLNILPHAVAEELKEFGRTSSAKHESATIMFTDFKGFTKFSEEHTPEEIVTIIDEYFRAFDEIIEKYGIEKIKTIGDAYMCVSGIPEANNEHAKNMILAAQEIRSYVASKMKALKDEGKPYLLMRIGLHSGPLVAGVVGSRKFAYDVWGDAVNIAARMEQSGEPGQINVSESVYELTKDEFQFEFRGEVDAKNKGKMKMYFLVET